MKKELVRAVLLCVSMLTGCSTNNVVQTVPSPPIATGEVIIPLPTPVVDSHEGQIYDKDSKHWFQLNGLTQICNDQNNPCDIQLLYQQFWEHGSAAFALYQDTTVYVKGTISSKQDTVLTFGKSHGDDVVASTPIFVKWAMIHHYGLVKLTCVLDDQGMSADDNTPFAGSVDEHFANAKHTTPALNDCHEIGVEEPWQCKADYETCEKRCGTYREFPKNGTLDDQAQNIADSVNSPCAQACFSKVQQFRKDNCL